MSSSERFDEAGGSSPRWTLVLWLLIGLGLCLRFVGLDYQSLWYDELLSLGFADPNLSSSELLARQTPEDFNPPLYYFLLNAWMGLFGTGEVAARSLSAFFSAGAVVVAAVWLRRDLGRPAIGIFLGLMACSFGGIYYAQEARTYGLLLFLSTVLTLLTVDAVRSQLRDGRVSWSSLLWISAMGLLASFSHYYGVLLLGACLGTLLLLGLAQRRLLWPVVLLGIVCLAIFVPWVLYHTSLMSDDVRNDNFWIEASERHYLLAAMMWFGKLLFGSYVGVALAVAGLIVGARKVGSLLKEQPAVLAAGLMVAFGLAFSVGLSLVKPTISGRNLLILLPAVYLLLAYVLARGMPPRRLAVLAPLGLAVMLAGGLYDYYEPHKEQWRESARFVQSQPGCENGRIVVAERRPQQRVQLAHFDYYRDPSNKLVMRALNEFGDLTTIADFVKDDDCAVILWAAHYLKPGVESLVAETGLKRDQVEIKSFRSAHVVLEKPES